MVYCQTDQVEKFLRVRFGVGWMERLESLDRRSVVNNLAAISLILENNVRILTLYGG